MNGACGPESPNLQKFQEYRLYTMKNNLQLKENFPSGIQENASMGYVDMYDRNTQHQRHFLLFFQKIILPEAQYISR